MALLKQPITIPLGPGIKTDVDEKILPLGKVVQLENCVWNRAGEAIKRPGNGLLGATYVSVSPGTMPVPWQLGTHNGALVSLSKAGPRPVGVYSPASAKWMTPPGSTNNDAINGVFSKLRGQVMPKRNTVFRNTSSDGNFAQVFSPSMATDGTYALVAWIENNNAAASATVQARIIELSTGKELFNFSTTASFGLTSCKCVYADAELHLIHLTGANVRDYIWTIVSITAGSGAPSAPFSLATDAGSYQMDAIAMGNDVYAVFNNAALTQQKLAKRAAGGAITEVEITDSGGGHLGAGTTGFIKDLSSSGKLAIITTSVASGARVEWDISGAGTPATSYTIDAGSGDVSIVTGFTISANASGEFVVLYGITAPGQPINIGRRTVASGVSHQAWIYSAQIGSKVFLHGSDFYVHLVYNSPTQGTRFIQRVPTNPADATDMTRTPSARYCSGEGLGMDQVPPPDVIALSADVFVTAAGVKVRKLNVASGSAGFDMGVDWIKATFDPVCSRPVEFAGSLYVGGGILGAFDGQTFAEEGFHLFPEEVSLSQSGGGSLTEVGTYYVSQVYRYIDANGRLRRSAPSVPTAIKLTAGNRTIGVTGKTLKLHGRPGSVVCEFYMNTNGETDEFFLVAVKANDETVDTVTVTLAQADTATALGELLYTTGDVLENQAPPPALSVTTYKDRLAVVSAEDPSLVWISLTLAETEGPRFNTVSSVRIDDQYGDLVGLASIDDKFIAFKENATYAETGDGPDAAGNGSFFPVSIIANGLGCAAADVQSIVPTPEGVMFRSSSDRSGIYLIGRGLSAAYIGADVDQYKTLTITGAANVTQLDRVEFFTAEGRTLVYDAVLKLWSTYTVQAAACVTVWRDRHIYQPVGLGTMGLLYEDQTAAVWTDNGIPYSQFALTPWVQPGGSKGYGRVYRLQGEGVTVGEHTLTVALYSNFTRIAAVNTAARVMLASDDWNAWEFRYAAKGSAFQIGITVADHGGTPNAGAKITALAGIFGVKDGLRKLASTARLT